MSQPDRIPTGLVCSAKACRAGAVHAVRWHNPRLHLEGRRKVWLACEEHVAGLASFVDLRGFLIDVVPVAELEPGDG